MGEHRRPVSDRLREACEFGGAVLPARKQVLQALVLLLPLLGAAFAAYLAAGALAAVACLFSALMMMGGVLALPVWPDCLALGALAVAACLGGLAVAGHTGWTVAAVSAAGLSQYFTNRRTAGAAALLPLIVFVLASSATARAGAATDRPFATTAFWSAIGVAVMVSVFKVSKVHVPAVPVDRVTAARHSLLMAGCCAAGTWISLEFRLVHGIWVILTLCMVFVPIPDQSRRKAADRIVATTVGGLVAFLLLLVLPDAAAVILALVFSVFSAAWGLKGLGEYRKSVFWTTVGVLLMAGTAAPVDTVLNRVVITLVVGVVVGALASFVAARPSAASESHA